MFLIIANHHNGTMTESQMSALTPQMSVVWLQKRVLELPNHLVVKFWGFHSTLKANERETDYLRRKVSYSNSAKPDHANVGAVAQIFDEQDMEDVISAIDYFADTEPGAKLSIGCSVTHC